MGVDTTDTTIVKKVPNVSGSEAENRVLPLVKKIPVTFTGGTFSPTEGFITRALSVNVDGDVNIQLKGDATPDVVTLVSGVLYPMDIKFIGEGSTTATGIIVWG